ncbi:MAG: hypothetical protein KBS52_00905 [Clostridiales bacterium]|nr:hypothetical protein [Candidatus Equinaster intestinalis]
MRRSKLLISLIALAAALVTLLAQPTLSYYSVLGEATNVITAGEIKCKIIEKMGAGDFPTEGVYITPGSIISKKVSVKNIGENPFWLRVKLKNAVDDTTLSADVLELDINNTDWTYGNDGYYYFNRILEPDEETEKLFTQVKVVGSADNDYIGKTVKLTVCAYAVQSEYNDAASPLEVVGWPAEG